MEKRIIIFFVALASASFFELIFVSSSIITASHFALFGLMFFLIFYHFTYDKTPRLPRYFGKEISLLLIAVVLSMFGASFFHGQSLMATALAQKAIYFYLLYYLLSYLKIHPDEMIRLFFVLGCMFIGIYLIQFILYPKMILSSKVLEERGTIRIYLTGGGFAFFLYFLSLSRFFQTKHIKYILLILANIVVFILIGSRQLIATVMAVTLAYLIISKTVKSKLLIGMLGAMFMVSVYLIFQDIFASMFEVSQDQKGDGMENVRLRAAIFFLYEFFPNTFSYIIGNGAWNPHSEYGSRIIYYMQYFGYFQADIGMIGEYSKYGLLFVLVEIFIYIRVIIMKLPAHLYYIKYMFAANFLMAFTGSGGFSEAANVVNICLVLYLIDAYKTIELHTESKKAIQNEEIIQMKEESLIAEPQLN